MVMRHSLMTLLAAALALDGAAASAAVETRRPPLPAHVTMYRDRAVVARRETVPLAAGMNILRYEKLPPNLQEVSLRARLTGEVQARIVNVTTWTDERREIQDDAVKAGDEQIAALDAELHAIEIDLLRAMTVQRYLSAYEAQLAGIVSAGTLAIAPDTAGWHTALSLVGDRREKTGAALAAGLRRKKALTERRGEAQAALQRLENPRPRTVRLVEIHVEADAAVAADIEIAYEMHNAGWKPVYDLREDADRGLTLQYYATIEQHTEEDWPDVAVTLSTAEPAVSGNRPRVAPLAVRAVKMDEPTQTARAEFAPAATVETPEVSPHSGDETPEMRVRREATSFAFELPGRLTIPRDGRLAKTCIATAPLAGQTYLWTMPLQSRLVYRRLKAANPMPFPLLEGAIYTYHRDTYVGVGQMAFTPVAGMFEATTGTDPEFAFENTADTVERRDFAGRETHTHACRARLRNDKPIPASLVLAFSLPVSEIEEVTVALDMDAFTHGEPTRRDDKQGLLEWTLELAPRAVGQVGFGYRVTGPRELLNQRVQANPHGPLLLH